MPACVNNAWHFPAFYVLRIVGMKMALQRARSPRSYTRIYKLIISSHAFNIVPSVVVRETLANPSEAACAAACAPISSRSVTERIGRCTAVHPRSMPPKVNAP